MCYLPTESVRREQIRRLMPLIAAAIQVERIKLAQWPTR
jgi:hypothetical protein